MAASASAQEAIWLSRLLEELGFRTPKPITICEEYFIREAVINGQIKLEYIPTLDQLADGLTKALAPDYHLKCFRELLSSYHMPDI
jgi:hypothetical protein